MELNMNPVRASRSVERRGRKTGRAGRRPRIGVARRSRRRIPEDRRGPWGQLTRGGRRSTLEAMFGRRISRRGQSELRAAIWWHSERKVWCFGETAVGARGSGLVTRRGSRRFSVVHEMRSQSATRSSQNAAARGAPSHGPSGTRHLRMSIRRVKPLTSCDGALCEALHAPGAGLPATSKHEKQGEACGR